MRSRLLRRVVLLVVLLAVPLGHIHAASNRSAAVARSPTAALQALLARAQAAFDRGDYVVAKALFIRATALAPRSAVAWAGKARSESWMHDDARAVIDYTTAIRYAPGNTTYLVRRGVSYDALDDWPHAQADYTEAIGLDPYDADAYFDRGSSYYNRASYVRSVTDYTRVIVLRPAWWSAYYYRAEGEYGETLLQGTGDSSAPTLYRATIADATVYIAQTGTAAVGDAYTLRGNAHSALRQDASALADYRRALTIGPARELAYYNVGRAAYLVGEYKLAIANLTPAITLIPEDPYPHYYRGLARRDSGNRSGAITDLRRAVQLFIGEGLKDAAQQAADALRRLQDAP